MADLGYGAADDNNNPYLGQANPYLQNVIDLSNRDLVRGFETTALPAFNAGMVRSGSFGNSGIQELAERGQQQLQTSLGDNASKLRFNDYSQQQQMYQADANRNEAQRQFDLGYGRNLFNDAYGQNQQNLQTGIGLLGTLQGFNQSDINNTTTQQNTPLQYWQQFANGANAIGSGGGQGVNTQGTTSNPLGAALGGAQLGTGLANYGRQNGWWGGNGNSSGTQAPASGSYDSTAWNNWATTGGSDSSTGNM